jgi:hypothetical protein
LPGEEPFSQVRDEQFFEVIYSFSCMDDPPPGGGGNTKEKVVYTVDITAAGGGADDEARAASVSDTFAGAAEDGTPFIRRDKDSTCSEA